MNKLIDDRLHIMWGWIKEKIHKNLKYISLPLIYIIIISLMVTKETKTVEVINLNRLDSYAKIVLNNDFKKDYILEKYNLTNEEFRVLCAIVLSEAEDNSYDDAYAVINTIYNRTKSKMWVTSVNNYYGNGKGENLYYQAIMPNQFVVYQHGSYKRHLDEIDSNGYQAIIDFLYTEEPLHNYLSFRSHNTQVFGSVSFSARGNNYFNEI